MTTTGLRTYGAILGVGRTTCRSSPLLAGYAWLQPHLPLQCNAMLQLVLLQALQLSPVRGVEALREQLQAVAVGGITREHNTRSNAATAAAKHQAACLSSS